MTLLLAAVPLFLGCGVSYDPDARYALEENAELWSYTDPADGNANPARDFNQREIFDVPVPRRVSLTPVPGKPAWFFVHSDTSKLDTLGFVEDHWLEELDDESAASTPWITAADLRQPVGFLGGGARPMRVTRKTPMLALPRRGAAVVKQIPRGTNVQVGIAGRGGWLSVFDTTSAPAAVLGFVPRGNVSERPELSTSTPGRASDCHRLDELGAATRAAIRDGVAADRAEERRNGPVIPGQERQFTAGEERAIRRQIEMQLLWEQMKRDCAR